MNMTIKKLPAILLAVIIAAALVLAMGMSQQTAYAGTAQKSIDKNIQKNIEQKLAKKAEQTAGEYFIFLDAEGYTYKALPNSKINLNATVYDAQFDDVTSQVPLTGVDWKVTKGDNVASVQGEGTQATVSFGDMPLDLDDVEVEVTMTATVNGTPATSYPVLLTMSKDFYSLVTTDVDEYLQIGDTATVTAEVIHFTENNREGLACDADFTWNYEATDVEITPTSGKGPFTVKRLSGADTFFWVDAKWTVDGNIMEDTDFFWFSEISNDLNTYTVEIKNNPDWIKYLDSITETFTPDVEVRSGGYVVDPSEYELLVEKYEGYDLETGDEYYVTVDPTKPLKLDPEPTYNKNYDSVGGTGFYRIKARAKAGGKFTGQTDDYPGWVNLYDRHTINDYNITLDYGVDNLVLINEYPYVEYNLTPQKAEEMKVPAITIADQEVSADKLQFKYYNIDTYDVYETIPTVPGEYLVIVDGVTPYYGTDVDTWIKIGDPNPMTVTGKNVKVKKGKKTTIKKAKAFKIKSKCGKPSFWLEDVNGKYSGSVYDKFSVAENGNITVKKGLKKGTYKVKVFVTSPGDATHIAYNEFITVKIKVK